MSGTVGKEGCCSVAVTEGSSTAAAGISTAAAAGIETLKGEGVETDRIVSAGTGIVSRIGTVRRCWGST